MVDGISALNGRKRLLWALMGSAVIALIAAGILWVPRTASMYFFKEGQAAFLSADYASAKLNLELALRLQPSSAEAEAWLARTLVASVYSVGGRAENAQEAYRESLSHFNKATELGFDKKDPSYHQFIGSQGIAYWGTGEYDRANELFTKVIADYPEGAFLARVFLARDYLERSNRPEEALEILTPVFEMTITDRSLLISAYVTALRLHNYFDNQQEMETYANLVLENAPEDDVSSRRHAYVNLAVVHSRRGELGAAKENIEKAETLYEEPGRFTCLLAGFYFENKQYDEARVAAEAGESPICLAVLGKVYLAEGNRAKAREYTQQSLDALKAIEPKNIFTQQGIKNSEALLERI
jgi:Tfp pilus assembly protein PilF